MAGEIVTQDVRVFQSALETELAGAINHMSVPHQRIRDLMRQMAELQSKRTVVITSLPACNSIV